MEYWFEIQGSQPEPYRISVRRAGARLFLDCTCPAGQVGTYCKHRIAIIDGDEKAIVSSSHHVSEVTALLPGTSLMAAIDELRRLERQADDLKRDIAKAKKALAREMLG